MEKLFEFFISLRVTNSQLFVFVFIHLSGYFYTGVTVSKYSPEKIHCVKSVQMRRNNCSPSINLLVNRHTFQEINTPPKFGGLECGIFTFKYGREGDNIFLGSM